ncbi:MULTISPECIES: DUF4376 domain-containing protein [unclassified Rhizobium]|uniref:DUF4376 domain-containing protein n=1 Tax=unclassified Rhizobium TaxID=2613769 RepID=UPI00160A8920|nr:MULTISPECIES: DUF4376 domain-containing protein [unclassified Rhizobium]MBB3381812.1 hypothetical protein [Rhizobium sp. BK098]MBB3613514.1 hypothetical protein [Rhizobium sp. BK609]MBB3679172.1 hypothetical protein [Rhizobium sp. BK612]
MYRIDSMYEPMVEALLAARSENKIDRWMACVAFWLGRQQIYNVPDYWLALAAKITTGLNAADKSAILDQLSNKEAALVSSAVDWPETPGSLLAIVAGWSPEPAPVDLYAYAASKRYAVETGGIVLNGMRVMTDRASQSLITGAYNYVQANPDVLVKFKTSAGFIELTAAQMTTIANAVGAHVQAAFAAESDVNVQIIDGMITTKAGVDAFAWPSDARQSANT